MDKIKVAIRARPLNQREINLGTTEAVEVNGNQIILTHLPENKDGRKSTKVFTYDCCFDSSSKDKPHFSTQETIYNSLGIEVLDFIFSGYNACIFAYGQTGSGKTYTMTGTRDNKGLSPRICEAIFEKISANTDTNCSFKVEVYYMEIYNEKCRDLLNPTQKSLRVREHQLLGSYVEGLSQLAVSSFQDIEVLMNEGNKSRTIAATNMNSESSRSHAVFCLIVSQNIIDTQSGISGEKVSRLSLVDLAGSEKVSKTGSEGDRLKEGCNINRSLLTLGQVISTLADNAQNKSKTKHIPYRDSILTWLLKDGLGGNSKTIMLSTISTAYDSYDETLSTLRYADRAKKIVNNAVVNEDPNAKIIRNLREELESLKKELEAAKALMNKDNAEQQLNDRLKMSEHLYNEMSKPWSEKLAESERVQLELGQKLETMGICVQSSGISVEKNKYYLVNINPDPAMNELLVYYLKDLTLVGRPDAKTTQDIQLVGPGIVAEHCAFYMKNNSICLTPIKSAKTRVNGYLISEETLLHHGDRIELGVNHFFRLNCPRQEQSSLSPVQHITSLSDFKIAQEEVLLSKVVPDSNDPNKIYTNKTPQSSDSIDEDSVNLEYAVRKFEQNYSNSRGFMSTSSSSSSLEDYTVIQTRKGLITLREQLLHANSLIREANSICKEMNLDLRFSVTLRIPAKNLTPNRKRDSLLSEPAILVKKSKKPNINHNQNTIDLEKFEFFIFQLRELYNEKNSSFLVTSIEPQSKDSGQQISSILDDYISHHNLIGVANLFLDSLFIDASIVFEYDVPILNQHGEISGLLKVKLQRTRLDESHPIIDEAQHGQESLQSVQQIRRLDFKLSIIEAIDLPVQLNNSVFCKFQFWSNNKSYVVPSKVQKTNKQTTVKFDFDNEFSIDLTEEFIEYCMDGSFSIQVLGQKEELTPYIDQSLKNTKENTPKKYAEAVEKYNQMIKYQGMIESWNEVSKAFELNIQILELNSDGNWMPVEVKQDPENNLTGGTYQLRQGQSRQISVRVNPTKANSIMWYNGILFNLEPHKIDRISVGCVLGKEALVTQPLDSYQDIDLTVLRDKCKQILETRKQYLYAQIKMLADKGPENQTDEEKERCESLCKQLVNLGEEQAAVDAPADNSGLPGSTIEWEPASGMETHVPIVFLDFEDENSSEPCNLSGDLNVSDDYYEDDIESHSSFSNPSYNAWNYDHGKTGYVRANNVTATEATAARTLQSSGNECFLKYESKDTRFVDLNLVRWNDSSLVEMVVSEEFNQNGNELASMNYTDQFDGESFTLKAVALWDSSIHQSPYLNQLTPLDRNVYVTVKINLKLKVPVANKHEIKYRQNKYIDLVLRKRIAVNVTAAYNTGAKFGLKRFTKLLTSTGLNSPAKKTTSLNMTSVIYRVILNIPKSLVEIENRESLALQAATSLANNSIEDQRFLEKSETTKPPSSDDGGIESSLTQFQHYAKTIAAVDSILKQDRLQQQMAIRSAFNLLQQNNNLNELQAYKIPSLLKTGFDSIMNLSSLTTNGSSADSPENSTANIFSKKIDLISITNEAKSRLTSMKTQLMDTANIPHNISFKSLLEMPTVANDPESVYDELRQLELEVERREKTVVSANIGLNFNVDAPEIKTCETVQKKTVEDPKTIETAAIIRENNIDSIKLDNKITQMMDEIKTIKSDFAKVDCTVEEPTNQLVFKEFANSELENLISSSLKISSSNNSIASTLTNLSQNKMMPCQKQQPDDELSEWMCLGAHVIVSTNTIQNKPGYIRFIGKTKFAHGIWIGVELEQEFGKNDGSLKGIRYFRCEENRGTFVRPDKLSLVKA